MKIAILYYSESGNTAKMADTIEAGILSVGQIEVKQMNLNQTDNKPIDADFVNQSSAVLFGTPTYVANMCWQMKQWFDTDWNCNLAGKLGGAFATANAPHGGADVAVLGIINHLLVKGMLVYSSGAGCGRPFIHLGPTALRDELEQKAPLFKLFGKRIAEKAIELFD
ncbi:MAG: flavodoxin family protein [Anaerofustis sp.]